MAKRNISLGGSVAAWRQHGSSNGKAAAWQQRSVSRRQSYQTGAASARRNNIIGARLA